MLPSDTTHEPIRYDPEAGWSARWCRVCGRSIYTTKTGDRHQTTAKAKIARRLALVAAGDESAR